MCYLLCLGLPGFPTCSDNTGAFRRKEKAEKMGNSESCCKGVQGNGHYLTDAATAAATAPAPSAAAERAEGSSMSVHTASIARTRVSEGELKADSTAVEDELDRSTTQGRRVSAVLNLYSNELAGYESDGSPITLTSVAFLCQAVPSERRIQLQYMLHTMHVEATETGSVHGNSDVLHQLAELSTDGWWLCGIIDTTERKTGDSGGVRTTVRLSVYSACT